MTTIKDLIRDFGHNIIETYKPGIELSLKDVEDLENRLDDLMDLIKKYYD